MSSLSKRMCREPNCPALVQPPVVRCPSCKALQDARRQQRQAAHDQRRGSASSRGYSAAWRKWLDGFRRGNDLDQADPEWAAKVAARNVCAEPGCFIRTRLEFHHKVPLRDRGELLDPNNVEPRC